MIAVDVAAGDTEMFTVTGRLVAIAGRIANSLAVTMLSFDCTLLIHCLDLLTETICVLFDLQKFPALESLNQTEGCHTVGIASIVHTLQTNLDNTGVDTKQKGLPI